MNTPTPETDAASKLPEHLKEYFVVPSDFARKLERERDEARAKKDSAQCSADARKERIENLQAERDQLREVCDELAKCLENPAIFQRMESIDAMCSYNSLPHVIAAKKGKAE